VGVTYGAFFKNTPFWTYNRYEKMAAFVSTQNMSLGNPFTDCSVIAQVVEKPEICFK
jgi:hypothetical protein